MRCLLLIVAVSSLCCAADQEAAKILATYSERRNVVQKQCLVDLVQHKDKNHRYIKAIILSADPKESEKKIAGSINSYNGVIDRFDVIAKGQYPDDILHLLGRTLGDLADMKANLIKTGVMKDDHMEQDVKVAIVEQPKPKEKKKITAVLADGTKIE